MLGTRGMPLPPLRMADLVLVASFLAGIVVWCGNRNSYTGAWAAPPRSLEPRRSRRARIQLVGHDRTLLSLVGKGAFGDAGVTRWAVSGSNPRYRRTD